MLIPTVYVTVITEEYSVPMRPLHVVEPILSQSLETIQFCLMRISETDTRPRTTPLQHRLEHYFSTANVEMHSTCIHSGHVNSLLVNTACMHSANRVHSAS